MASDSFIHQPFRLLNHLRLWVSLGLAFLPSLLALTHPFLGGILLPNQVKGALPYDTSITGIDLTYINQGSVDGKPGLLS